MKLHAFVLHNVSRDMFFRYDAKTSVLHHAHTFQVEADDLGRAADLIWILTNVGSVDELRINTPYLAKYADQMIHYRQRENRSLSVGDVIVFYERERLAGAFAVASVGFEALMGVEGLGSAGLFAANDRPVSEARRAHQEFGLKVNGSAR